MKKLEVPLNVKAKINLILNDFQLILKGDGVELMGKVKKLQFDSLQMKTSLFFTFIQCIPLSIVLRGFLPSQFV